MSQPEKKYGAVTFKSHLLYNEQNLYIIKLILQNKAFIYKYRQCFNILPWFDTVIMPPCCKQNAA